MICARLVDGERPLLLAVDDTLYRRAGRKVWGAAWHHDPLAAGGKGRKPVCWANCWVVVGVLVHLPFMPNRAVCLPVLARLWRPRQPGRSKLDLACELVGLICARVPDRRIHLVCDAAYAGKALHGLPAQVTVTTRLRCDAALYQLAPPPTGRRGRPRVKGERLPELEVLAGMVATPFALLRVTRYGRCGIAAVAHFTCLWPSVFGARPVHVVLVRDPDAPDGFDLALVSTDLDATAAELVGRYADRWQVEVLFEDSRQVTGVGQARNRTQAAVERTVPFGLLCLSLTVVWYAAHGQPTVDVAARRALVQGQARPIGGRHAHRTAPRATRHPISAIFAGRAHPPRNPRGAGSLGRGRRMNYESRDPRDNPGIQRTTTVTFTHPEAGRLAL